MRVLVGGPDPIVTILKFWFINFILIHLFNFFFLLFTVCYSIIFNGRRLSHRYIERSVAVISLDECKLLCTRETSFDCRSFNYRYKLSDNKLRNKIFVIKYFCRIKDGDYRRPTAIWVEKTRPVWTWPAAAFSFQIPTWISTSASVAVRVATAPMAARPAYRPLPPHPEASITTDPSVIQDRSSSVPAPPSNLPLPVHPSTVIIN